MEAIAVAELYLQKRNEQPPSTSFLIQLLYIVLENNCFHFQDLFYFQIQGVAVESLFASTIANLFVHNLEDETVFQPSSAWATHF